MKKYKIKFDCTEWLPPYDEYDIVIHPRGKGCDIEKHGGGIIVDIFYDNLDENTNDEYPFAKRSYIFKFVTSFYQSIWPLELGGIDPMCPASPYKIKEKRPLSALFEINDSLLAKKWDEYWEKNSVNKKPKKRHFRQYFNEASTMIDVICEDVELTDKVLLKTEEWEWKNL